MIPPPSMDGRLRVADGSDIEVRVQLVGRVLAVSGPGISRAVPLNHVAPIKRDDGAIELRLSNDELMTIPRGDVWESAIGYADEGSSTVATTVGPPSGVLPVSLPAPQSAQTGSWIPLAVVAITVVALGAAIYTFAIPAAARLVLALVPTSVDAAIGDVVFRSMDGLTLRPSRLAAAEQARLRAAFDRAVQRADGPGATRTALEFRDGDIGPNAFALPGGRIVVTDTLVTLVDGREDVVIGVLGHEYGHSKARHGVRMVAQAALLGTVMSALFGDFSALLVGAPQVLGEQAYSRNFEREADAESVRVLRAGGYSPRAMVFFFEKLAEQKLTTGRGLAIAFASHPADAERVEFFTRAADAR